ncbi:Pr6Pr family membrane protein [Nocardioides sp. WG-D5]
MALRTAVAMRAWYAVVAVVVGVGFVLQFYLLFTGGADANSGESGHEIPLAVRFARLFSFFTVDSNVLVLAVATAVALGRAANSVASRAIGLSALLGITVTGTVFSLVLAPGIELRGEAVVATNLFHIASPVLFVLGWLLWGPRRQWDVRIAVLAFVWPIAWLVLTLIRGAITGWYPYPFLDVGQNGMVPVLLSAAAVLGYAIVLTAVLLLVDRYAPVASLDHVGRSSSRTT